MLVYGDQFESMPDSGAELLCFICARASEIDEFVERAVAWLDTAECAQFIERARSSDYGPHRRFLADLGTPKLRQRIECVAETAKALLELELNFYAPRQED